MRWLQAAVFSSHMRVHGIGEREPWAFGAEAEAIARKWLAFRYRLLPYLERVIAQATTTGMPVMRAMPLAFPGNALDARLRDAVHVRRRAARRADRRAPAAKSRSRCRRGAWYDLNSRQRMRGRPGDPLSATLDQFPVFGREGYALPLGPRGPAHRRDRSSRGRSSALGVRQADARRSTDSRRCASTPRRRRPSCTLRTTCASTVRKRVRPIVE